MTYEDFLDTVTERLLSLYCPDEKLFYSSAQFDGESIQYELMPDSMERYTINSFLGLTRVADRPHLSDLSLENDIQHYYESRYEKIENFGDIGLLLLLFVELNKNPPGGILDDIKEHFQRNSVRDLTLQEISWLLWGLVRYSEDSGSHRDLTWNLYHRMERIFFDDKRELPLHATNWYRKDFTSFGALVYCLRALYEFSRVYEVTAVRKRFNDLTETIIDHQGPKGQWPWFYDNVQGSVVDTYPVYSVHQDSMAFLFLEKYDGANQLEDTVLKSLDWIWGQNEIGELFFDAEHSLVYRSLYRRGFEGLVGRGRRLARGYFKKILNRRRSSTSPEELAVNRECRSYHLGWILYIWGKQPEFSDQLIHSIEGETL